MRWRKLTPLVMLGPGIFAIQAAMADDLPVPPIPPEHPPLAETAPVPNANAQAPVVPPLLELDEPEPLPEEDNIDDLRRQMKDMQERLDRMSKEPKKDE